MNLSIRQIAIAKLLFTTLAGTALAEQYVCQTEQMTGFADQGDEQWVGSRFTNRPSFLVDTKARTVTEFGVGLRHSNCTTHDPLMLGYMTCAYLSGTRQFAFNSNNLRFAEADIFGYVAYDLEEPWLLIGTCAELGG